MKIDILTLFPEMYDDFLKTSIIGRAIQEKKVTIEVHNIRDFSLDKHHRVDDYGYGGGDGMVLMPEPIKRAIDCYRKKDSKVILLTPQGIPLKQKLVKSLATYKHIILVCGHYEGFDERIRSFVDMEISIGDYVLTGGELPAMVLIDSVSRYVEGVLAEDSTKEESFSQGYLEYSQYTRPEEFNGKRVPEVLTSGNHQKIEQWRRKSSLINTFLKRPELLDNEKIEEAKKIISEENESEILNK